MTRWAIIAVALGALAACAAKPEPTLQPVTLEPEKLPSDPTPVEKLPEPQEVTLAPTSTILPLRLFASGSAKYTLVPDGALKVSEVHAVNLSLEVLNGPAGGAVHMELVAPSGLSYERQEQQLQAGKSRLDFTVPVAGTLIQQVGMSGTWTAHFTLDGRELATQQYSLSP